VYGVDAHGSNVTSGGGASGRALWGTTVAANASPKFWTPVSIDANGRDPYIGLCQLDWDTYHAAPYKYPMFKDLMVLSKCSGANYKSERMSVLWKEYEENAGGLKHNVPTAFVFHESRVGSTLVANTFGSDSRSLVFSESPPPVAALLRCTQCTSGQGKDRFRKLLLLMGVSTVHEVTYRIIVFVLLILPLDQLATAY
jgi:hypothetical protein